MSCRFDFLSNHFCRLELHFVSSAESSIGDSFALLICSGSSIRMKMGVSVAANWILGAFPCRRCDCVYIVCMRQALQLRGANCRLRCVGVLQTCQNG